jgi:hypothetical protein
MATKKQPQQKKDEQISAKLHYENFQLLKQIIEENNLSSQGAGIAELCRVYREWKSQPHSEPATVAANDADLPQCIRRVQDTKGVYWCVFKRPCTPVQAKELKTLEWCKSCKAQEHGIPANAPIATVEPAKAGEQPEESEEREAEDEPEIHPNESIRNQWFVRDAKGAKLCPFPNVGKVQPHDCKRCQREVPRQAEKCTRLYAEYQNISQSTMEPPKPKWTPIENTQRRWFNALSDGSKICPFSPSPIYPSACKTCAKMYPEKHDQCVRLFEQTQLAKVGL